MKNFAFILFCLFTLLGCKNISQNAEKTDTEKFRILKEKVSEKELGKYKQLLSYFFDTTLLYQNFSGGILIAKQGNILYEKYAGLLPDTIKPVTPLHIASVSKTFTAIAILKLVQDKKLELNDNVTKFFPSFPYENITIKTLLNHRSGLPNYLYFLSEDKELDRTKPITNETVLNYLIQKKPAVNFIPDRHFSYCNTNYTILAKIIEKVAEQSLKDFFSNQFFKPLGMKNSFLNHPFSAAIISYRPNGSPWESDLFENTYGDKNICTTMQDLFIWAEAVFNYHLIKKPLLDSAFLPYSNERPSMHNYGLGFRLLELPNGKKVIYHFGRWHGCNAVFARLPQEKVNVLIIGNRYTRSIYSIGKMVYSFFGDYGMQYAPSDKKSEAASDDNSEKE